MTFRVINDRWGALVEYEGRPYARLLPNLGPTFSDQALDLLEHAKHEQMDEKDHWSEVRALEREHEQERGEMQTRIKALERELDMIDPNEGGVAARLAELNAKVDAANDRAEKWRVAYEYIKAGVEKRAKRKPRT